VTCWPPTGRALLGRLLPPRLIHFVVPRRRGRRWPPSGRPAARGCAMAGRCKLGTATCMMTDFLTLRQANRQDKPNR
jgi:hypothetical protein